MPFHLAQINIARARAAMDSPVMAEFAAALAEINALAEASPGFIWRLKTEAGDATSIQAFDDPRMLVNMSVWESVETLKAYVYRTMHAKFFGRRREWFEPMEEQHLALWWVAAGEIPTVDDGKSRLAHLIAKGETPRAFTFRKVFPPPS